MPKLGIELDNNINKTTSDFKKLNKEVDGTEGKIKKVDTASKQLGKTMTTAFSAFLIGGGVQRGFAKLLTDIDESNKRASKLTESLKTLRFLSSKEEIASTKRLRESLAGEFGFSPSRVGPIAADIKSAAGDLSISTRNQILEEAAAGGAGGVGGTREIAQAITQTSLLDPSFQTPEGITGLNNAFNQGIKEAILLPQDIGILQASVLAGEGAGLNVAESIGNFAAIRPNTVSKDDAREKQKQVFLLYKNSGFREKGISFFDWIDEVAATPFNELPENYKILSDIIIKLSQSRKITAQKTARIASAQANPASLNRAAFQKQLADPQQFQNITNERQAALKELISADPNQRADTEALGDIGTAGGNILSALAKTIVSLNPTTLSASISSGITGSDTPDLGSILRGSAKEDIRNAGVDLDAITSALNTNNSTGQSQNANLQVNRRIEGGF